MFKQSAGGGFGLFADYLPIKFNSIVQHKTHSFPIIVRDRKCPLPCASFSETLRVLCHRHKTTPLKKSDAPPEAYPSDRPINDLSKSLMGQHSP